MTVRRFILFSLSPVVRGDMKYNCRLTDAATDIPMRTQKVLSMNNSIINILPTTFLQLSLCREIVLENNYLTRIKTTDFSGVQHIEILNLKGNLISSIQPYAFIHMTQCKYLRLKANKLTSIEEETQSLFI